jgi:hypothetical protein
MRCTIDHLTITAPTLESGAAHVERALGVAPAGGGRHPRMGTHNRLLRLGPSRFLEVIAIDPAAPAPARPRWFGLDDAAAMAAPRLATWVARTDDLRAFPAALLEDVGAVEPMTRGEREWLITIRPDGLLPPGGVLPSLIEWTTPRTPAALALPESGCDLRALVLSHPRPRQLRVGLAALGLVDEVEVVEGTPGVSARVSTPCGLRVIGVDHAPR